MKKAIITALAQHLAQCAKRRVKNSGGKIIAISGSIGKTTTKDAIATVLLTEKQIVTTVGNYNTEIGLPLTILELRLGSKWQWPQILMQSFLRSFSKKPVDAYVLELGVDRPGDMQKLLEIITPDIAVLTYLSAEHVNEGHFRDEQQSINEELYLLQHLPSHAYALVNNNSPLIQSAQIQTSAQVLSYGDEADNTISIPEKSCSTSGLECRIKTQNKEYKIQHPSPALYLADAFAPAIFVGEEMKISTEHITQALENFPIPAGRFRIIPGIKNSTIIDSSYNSSPAALRSCLENLDSITAPRKIAVLGSMNELGQYSEAEHRNIGKIISSHADILITVGESAKWIAEEARSQPPFSKEVPKAEDFFEGSNSQQILSFTTNLEAGKWLRENIVEQDLLLVKGSQGGIFLEETIKMIMISVGTQDLASSLVRQNPAWKKAKQKLGMWWD